MIQISLNDKIALEKTFGTYFYLHLPPSLKKEEHIALHMLVGMFVGVPQLLQQITQECFDRIA